MSVLHSLCLPIVLSAVVVFVASFILHMALPWHKGDYGKVPDEDKVMDALRPFNLPAGDYMLPRFSSNQEMKSPEFAEKLKRGPVIILTVLENCAMKMGRSLGLWFLHLLIVSYFAAYVSFHAQAGGAAQRRVICLAGVTAFLGYSGALWQMWIWYRRSLKTTIKSTIYGAIYALLTAAVFSWIWPH